MTGYSDWKVVAHFDFDDYYKVGRDVICGGKLHWEATRKKYRNKAEAYLQAEKLNKETQWH